MPKRAAAMHTESDERCVRVQRASPGQVAEARRWLRAVLGPDHGYLDDAQLVLSELVTNAVEHGSRSEESPIRIVVRQVRGTWVFLSVTDGGRDGGRAPVPTSAGPSATRGRGLPLVDQLAIRWGAMTVGTGHCVYALLSALAPASDPRKV